MRWLAPLSVALLGFIAVRWRTFSNRDAKSYLLVWTTDTNGDLTYITPWRHPRVSRGNTRQLLADGTLSVNYRPEHTPTPILLVPPGGSKKLDADLFIQQIEEAYKRAQVSLVGSTFSFSCASQRKLASTRRAVHRIREQNSPAAIVAEFQHLTDLEHNVEFSDIISLEITFTALDPDLDCGDKTNITTIEDFYLDTVEWLAESVVGPLGAWQIAFAVQAADKRRAPQTETGELAGSNATIMASQRGEDDII